IDIQIEISIAKQQLKVLDVKVGTLAAYAVSTSLKGAGEQMNSNCTPRGRHVIRAKIGKESPVDSVFRGRRHTSETWTPGLDRQYPGRDWILTRILWLSGCEHGFNRLGNVDTMQRYIYIHGTPDTEPMGKPGSHGCIRMHNEDVVALFDMVPAGSPVFITDA